MLLKSINMFMFDKLTRWWVATLSRMNPSLAVFKGFALAIKNLSGLRLFRTPFRMQRVPLDGYCLLIKTCGTILEIW